MSVERSPKLITPYLAVYLFVIGLTFYLTMNYWPQTNIDSMKKVRIDHGTTLSTISDKLNKKGLVSNKWVFEFLTKIKGLEKSMQAGTFRLSNVHNNNEVINNIVFGSPDRRKITFLEGWNMNQVAKHLSEEGLQIVVLEKEKRSGESTSSRNSGVIHAGMYYPENSLKAKLCVEGNNLLYNYASNKNIPHKKIGKYIVSSNESEEKKLIQIYENGKKNSVDLEIISKTDLKEKLPYLSAVSGIFSPCLLYTSPSPRARTRARMPSSA